MPADCRIAMEWVGPELLAAVQTSVRIGDVARRWKPPLDEVWAFLKANEALRPGQNVFLYHLPEHRDGARRSIGRRITAGSLAKSLPSRPLQPGLAFANWPGCASATAGVGGASVRARPRFDSLAARSPGSRYTGTRQRASANGNSRSSASCEVNHYG